MRNRFFINQILFLFLLIFCFLISFPVISEETKIDLNDYYKYPLSIGLEYQSLSPFEDYGKDFNVYEMANRGLSCITTCSPGRDDAI